MGGGKELVRTDNVTKHDKKLVQLPQYDVGTSIVKANPLVYRGAECFHRCIKIVM